ncbi:MULTISPECIES: TIGR03915 family putative DNA repair protein [unclassified Acinetobacter]|uniref:TIGR03915 family putative DNA repair protein n=1 Tax=unclassified Acinetobacter TaxID=196816 RepID=UPI0035BB802A
MNDVTHQYLDLMASQNAPRTVILYHGGFAELLSAIFYVYQHKLQNQPELVILQQHHYQQGLFDECHHVEYHEQHSQRVLNKITALFGEKAIRQFLMVNASEYPHVAMTIFKVIQYALNSQKPQFILQDYSHPAVMDFAKIIKSMGREIHRMTAFVRFEHTKQDIYFARIEPDFDVLPFIQSHFAKRYQDQDWLIYDIKRGYGIFYQWQSKQLQLVDDIDAEVIDHPQQLHSEHEQRYQQFWQGYFKNVTINERKNRRLHLQYLPKRYWKYLSEKQVLGNESYLQKKR